MERKSAWSLPMTEQEIVKEYKEAKSPRTQIGILADQNGCEKKPIVNILEAAGCELPGNYKKKKKEQPLEETEAAPEEAPDFAKVQPLNEEQKETEEALRGSTSTLAKELTKLKAERGPLKIKATAYDTIMSLYPESNGSYLDFALMISGINDLVNKLIKEA